MPPAKQGDANRLGIVAGLHGQGIPGVGGHTDPCGKDFGRDL